MSDFANMLDRRFITWKKSIILNSLMAHYFGDALNCIFVKFHGSFLLLLTLAESAAPKLPIRWVLEVIHQISGALDSCIGQLAYLFAVEAVPPPAVELLIELKYEFGVYEVCKGVAHIARVGVIDRQVQEVYMHSMVFAYLFQQHVLRILVWNMPDHKRCTKVALDLRHRSFTFSGIMRYSLAY